MQSHFGLSEIDERAQAVSFSSRFGVQMSKIPQGPGVCGDYVVTETSHDTSELEVALGHPLLGKLIEFKNDKASLKTGNFYIEFEQTGNGWFTSKPSGHAKAIEMGCILVISSGANTYIFNENSFPNLLQRSTRELTTRAGRNGNPPGVHTRAKIVPVKHGKSTASYYYNTTEQREPRTLA